MVERLLGDSGWALRGCVLDHGVWVFGGDKCLSRVRWVHVICSIL